eukprot:148679_1
MSTYHTQSQSGSHTPLINVPNTAHVTRQSLPPRRMLSNGGHYHLRRRVSSNSGCSPRTAVSPTPYSPSPRTRSSTSPTSPGSFNYSYQHAATAGFFRRATAAPPRLCTLYQSSSLSDHEHAAADAQVLRIPTSPSTSGKRLKLQINTNPKMVTFSPRNFIDAYTPSPRTPMSPSLRTPSVSSYSSSLTTPSNSCISTASSSSLHSSSTTPRSLRLPNLTVQRLNTTSTTVSIIQKLKPCPHMVHNKCKCKALLAQNEAAMRVWKDCRRTGITNRNYARDHREIEVAYFEGLYTGLCEYMTHTIRSKRVPGKRDISDVVQQFGAFTLDSGEVVIDRCHFISFWRWFRGSCQILKDIYNLWDTKYPFQLNLFMSRKQCEEILRVTSHGTFLVRLSSRQNALVVSYSEQTFDGSTKIRHILLIRKSLNNYMAKTNKNSHKCTEINKLIRSFAKLLFIYTPNCIYKKNHVF